MCTVADCDPRWRTANGAPIQGEHFTLAAPAIIELNLRGPDAAA